MEEAVCFTRRLHPNDAKPVPEGQNSPENSSGLRLQSFRKGRGRQVRTDGGVSFDHHQEGRQTRTRRPQHTGLSGNLRPDAERSGLRQADEGRNLPNGWRAEEGAIPNGLLLLHGSRSGEHSQAALPSSLVRWNQLSSPCHNNTEN